MADLPEFTMTGGPLEVSDRVLRAMARQTMYHYDPLFLELHNDTIDKLKKIFQTKNDLIIMHGEAVLGLEAAAASTIEPGDKCLNLATGPFGKGYGRHVTTFGGELLEIEVPFNESIDPEAVRDMFRAHPDIKVLSVVHSETPAGTLNPIEKLCPIAKEHQAITIVDAVSSVGGMQCLPDEWGVDICIVGPQKCLGAPPGSALVSVSKDAWQKMLGKSEPLRGSVLSMLDFKERLIDNGRFPYTPSVNQVYAVREAAAQLLEEGLEHAFARHRAAALACRAGIKAMGLELWPASEDIMSTCVTAVKMPDGVTDKALRAMMRDKYGVMISGGHGDLIGKLFRIGHMGKMAGVSYVLVALAALEKTLTDLGVKVPAGAGVSAALATA
ncbi:MAG: alanine--glyoxylate aminotransferase family protein [Chloroflexi bacterium]|nr:alanine--glyoxylate aminotransferase family protein [Chloroflexota bacterium]